MNNFYSSKNSSRLSVFIKKSIVFCVVVSLLLPSLASAQQTGEVGEILDDNKSSDTGKSDSKDDTEGSKPAAPLKKSGASTRIKATEKKIEEDDDINQENIITPIDSLTEVSDSVRSTLYPGIDDSTGALVYSVEITTPPGRGKIEPNLALTYNSIEAQNSSPFGAGWSVNIPFVERINKTGTEEVFTENNYASSFSGELVSSTSVQYRARIENGNFLSYEKMSDGWKMIDKEGTIYLYGTASTTRQDDQDDSSKISKWMLEEVRDQNDNYISYEYTKHAGQIYPSRIVYTGNGTTPGSFEVYFSLVYNSAYPKSYKTGFSVDTEYQVDEIQVKVNNAWVRKYSLEYVGSDVGRASLLGSVLESGRDEAGNAIELPEMTFTYTTADANWSQGFSTLPISFVDSSGEDFGMRTADINGDGLEDILCHNDQTNGTCSRSNPEIYLNTGSGWVNVNSTWSFPYRVDNSERREGFLDDAGDDSGLRLIDVNGDMRVDMVRGRGSNRYTYLNTGSGWTYAPGWNLPMPFITSEVNDFGMRMSDINGDGLPDIICHNEQTNGSCSRLNPEIYLNTGSGWVSANNVWSFPVKAYDSTRTEVFLDSDLLDTGLRSVDVNGDNLPDLVKGIGSGKYTYLNTGSGWKYDPQWTIPLPFINVSREDYGVRMADFNGDSLPDFLCHNEQTNHTCGGVNEEFYINTGAGWQNVNNEWDFPVRGDNSSFTESFLTNTFVDTGLRVLDVNGDGLDDLVRAIGATKYTYLNNERVQSNMLQTISFSSGGSTEVNYTATPQFRSGSTLLNPNTQIVSHVVSNILTNDGLGGVASTTYSYEGAEYYFASYTDRRFAGFGLVEKTDPAGNVTKTYFHQGNESATSTGEYSDHISKMGKPYRVEQYDSNDNLYSKTINKWDRVDLGSGASLVKLVDTVEFSYDGDSDHKEKATSFVYDDARGNVLQKTEYGEVTGSNDGTFSDTGSDKFTTTISYASSSPSYDHRIYLPSQEVIIDQSSNKVREVKTYYDALPHGYITDGNPTKQEHWVVGTTYVDTEKTYNSYGLVTQDKDPRDKTTSYTYDAYNLYPATTTNPLGQKTEAYFDYSSGKPKQVKDVNGNIFQTVFDGLDRVKEEKQPDLSATTTLVTKATYSYTDTGSLPRAVHKTSFLNGATSTDAYVYVDGFGRMVQERVEAEDSNTFTVKDTKYNSIGKVLKESLPYFSTGASSTAATTTSTMYVQYEYDPLYRVTSVENAVGETTTTYDDWRLTVVDPNSEIKRLFKDGYGNLIKVEEINSSTIYTTLYEYNGNKNLTKITDALGNIRNFTYDGLGRQLTAEDLHASGDTYFGTWTYTYDAAGNRLSQVDPKSQTVNFTYDDVNRVLTENYTGSGGTEIMYAYDTCTGGKGMLCTVTNSGANFSYEYFPLGLLKKETKTISGTAYDTAYTYDRLGNIVSITHPDASVILYGYNAGGLTEKVYWKEDYATSATTVVTDIDYAPTGQISYQKDGNGVETTNTFNPAALYRLTQKVTVKATTTPVTYQNIAYTYDAVGNITNLVESATTSARRTAVYQYDDLHRLTRASSTNAASNYLETYTYNAIGNITNKSDQGSYTYAGNTGSNYANPHAATAIASAALTYDNNGNLLTFGPQSNAWDYKNRLTQTGSGTATSTNTYDYTGERVKYTNNSGTTTIYVSKFYDTADSVVKKHVYIGDNLALTIEATPNEVGNSMTPPDEGESIASGGIGGSVYTYTLHYVHGDHLSGSNVVTDDDGVLEETMDYLPFGKVRVDDSVTGYSQGQKYTGHEYDDESQLSYMGARYQNGKTGTFLSQDPVFLSVGTSDLKQKTNLELQQYLSDPQGLNGYSYSRNNPIKSVDPNGEWFKEVATGKQSPSDFQIEVGQAANQLSQDSQKWNTAISHPYETGVRVGVGSGVLALGGVVATEQALVGVNLARLSSLPMLSRVDTIANKGFDAIQKATGLTKSEAIKIIQATGESLVDLRNSGNINNVVEMGNKAIRITTNPNATKIISAGVMETQKLANHISTGAMRAVPTITNLIKNLSK